MATNDELRAAAERAVNQAYPATGTAGHHGLRHKDAFMLAEAWLREHPADDGEAITEEWLLSVGFEPIPYSSGRWIYVRNEYGHLDYASVSRVWDYGSESLNPPKTRGDVRRLCAALGIQLKEPSHA